MTRNNQSASIKQRLLNKARNDKRPFAELLQYFAMERFLYRLSCSTLVDKFVLKGALMLTVWKSPMSRATMDIDMLARHTSNEIREIISQVKEICSIPVDNDGLQYDLETIQGHGITEDADYEGVRIKFIAWLDTARVNMQMDIDFGDIVLPEPKKSTLPTILDFNPPNLFCYSIESAIAEKFDAIIKLGELNSRMKDFYDIWLLARQFNFNGMKLQTSIIETLKNRDTTLPPTITGLSENFAQIKSNQWKAFRNKLNQETVPEEFSQIVNVVKSFLEPITDAIRNETDFTLEWSSPGSWQM